MRIRLQICLLLLILIGSGAAQEPRGLSFEDRSTTNAFNLDGGVLTISSSRGVGTVVIRPGDGENWPGWKAVRFEYSNGRGMKVLEGLRIRTNEGVPRPTYTGLKPQLSDGALELNLPEELLPSTKYVEIHWVDFYRH